MTSPSLPQFPCNDPERDERLLDRYFAGECTAEEHAVVDAWFAANPDKRAIMATVRHVARYRVATMSMPKASALWAAFETRVHAAEPVHAVGRGARRWADGIGIAAAAAILVVAGLSWFGGRAYTARAGARAATAAREVATRRGERATLDLTDGTRVVLAPDSRLRIPAAYGTHSGVGARDVELDGEAWFEVKHDSTKPFRVRTKSGIAEDLGTEFVVTAYAATRRMRVVVASGAVGIRHRADTAVRALPLVLLRRGDLASIDSLGLVKVVSNIDVRRYISWTSGRLAFEKTPLPDALESLMRWYDVEFRLADPALADRRVTVTFDRSSLQNVVQFLELSLDVRAERNGRVVTFFARAPRSSAGGAASSHGGNSNR